LILDEEDTTRQYVDHALVTLAAGLTLAAVVEA
jgi:hypothetical protein